MRVKDFILPESVEGWVNLREVMHRELHHQHSRGSLIVVLLLMCSHVISMMMFMISAIRHTRTKDRALSFRDSEGYIQPKMHTTTPILVGIYGTLAFLALASFSRQLDVCTTILHFVSVSVGLMLAWEQIILTAYALPSHKYRFQTTWSPRRVTMERHLLTPNQFNFIIIAGALLPFVVPAITGVQAIQSFARARSQWKIFDTTCHHMIHFLRTTPVPYDSTSNILKFTKETQLLFQLLQLNKMGEKILFYVRWTAGLFFFVSVLQSLVLMFLQIRILRCLFSRLKVLRDRCILRQELRSERPVSGSEKSSSVSAQPTQGEQDEDTINLKDKPVESWTDWLPRYIREDKLDRSQSTSKILDKKETFGVASRGTTLQQQYIITRVYTVNLTWVAVLILFPMVSTMLCCLATALNWYDAPDTRNYLEAVAIQIIWTNFTWGGGSGILLGILKIMIASSPVPALPREPSATPITRSIEQ